MIYAQVHLVLLTRLGDYYESVLKMSVWYCPCWWKLLNFSLLACFCRVRLDWKAFMWQLVIDKCYKCACDWLTLKCLWPIVVETDAMSQIDIDNTCYVGDRSCNVGSHREVEGQLSWLIWSSSEPAAGRKKGKVCWRSLSFSPQEGCYILGSP